MEEIQPHGSRPVSLSGSQVWPNPRGAHSPLTLRQDLDAQGRAGVPGGSPRPGGLAGGEGCRWAGEGLGLGASVGCSPAPASRPEKWGQAPCLPHRPAHGELSQGSLLPAFHHSAPRPSLSPGNEGMCQPWVGKGPGGRAGEEERQGQCRDHPEGPSRQRELPELWPASIRALWGRESRWPLSLRDGGWCAWGRNCLGLGFKIPKSDGRQWREGSETGTGSEWELWGDPWGRGEGCWSPPAAAGLPGSEFLDGPSDGRASLTPRSVCPSAHPATHWDRPLPASARGLGPGAL